MLVSFLALVAVVQDPEPAVPASRPGSELARTASGITVSRSEYLEHLYANHAHARLDELVLDRVLAAEVKALPSGDLVATTRAVLLDPGRAAAERIAERVRQDHGGDREAHRALCRELGFDEGQLLRAETLVVLREARLAALVQAARRLDPLRLRRVFEERYGVDGVRVQVRHVYQSFGAIAAEHRARGSAVPLPQARVEALCRERMEALWQAAASGVAFEDLVAKGSEDPEARRMALDPGTRAHAGQIPGYDFQHFGVEFAEAVRAMRPGEVKGPIRTTHGYHIVKLDAVTRTEFAAVLEEVKLLARAEAPSLAERRELLAELAKRHGWPGLARP